MQQADYLGRHQAEMNVNGRLNEDEYAQTRKTAERIF
jgi:hypothetical protein